MTDVGHHTSVEGSAAGSPVPCPLCRTDGGPEIFRFLRPRSAAPTGQPTESLYGRAGRLVRCPDCGLVRQDPAPAAPYDEAVDPDYLAEEPGIRETFRRTLDRIERYRGDVGRLLDVGCGPGLLLEEATRRGWKAVGVEPSSWGAEEAERRGFRVLKGSLEDAELRPASFGAVVASDVIEHVPDPVRFSARLHELLEPGGIVFLATPNVDSLVARVLRRWWWSVLPGHLFYFSRATLSRVVEAVGFRVLEIGTHPKTFSLDYYAGRLSGYSSWVSEATRALVRLLDAGRLVTPDFRDRVACVAVKPAGSDDAAQEA